MFVTSMELIINNRIFQRKQYPVKTQNWNLKIRNKFMKEFLFQWIKIKLRETFIFINEKLINWLRHN